MIFEHRSFKGKNSYRPLPEIYFSEKEQLLIAATAWGSRASAARVVQIVTEYYHATKQDQDTTSPFERLTCLSPTANNLRIATLVANDLIYREVNQQEYVTGIELFMAAKNENEVAWLKVGMPNVVLFRPSVGAIPLSGTLDLAAELSQNTMLAPLPGHLLGLDPTINLLVDSFYPQSQDQLILASRSEYPNDIFKIDFNRDVSLENLSECMVRENPSSPFCWAY